MIYDIGYWGIKEDVHKLSVVEMRILKWINV